MNDTMLYHDHSRQYHRNKFVYPVLSRRSHGLSLGVNLNPDKVCNFDCIYCQVDRTSQAETRFVETEQLYAELTDLLKLILSGEIYEDPKFSTVPLELRRLNDIAFSGDGEPTSHVNFPDIVQQVAEIKQQHSLETTKLVLITNASLFHRPTVQRAMEILAANNGEIWAKLDAGTPEYFNLVERTKIRFQRILDNITQAARLRPLVIQSLFMKIHGEPPSREEIHAYCDRLNEILTAGGQLQLIQVYTVARQPAESFVAPLENAQVDDIAQTIRQQTGLSVEEYYST